MRIMGNRKRCSVVLIAAALFMNSSFIYAQSANETKAVQISFQYAKVPGFSSNQYAIWVESASGEYVRTVYVTRFTATKGWKTRPEAIPTWVKKSNISRMGKGRVDTISGATPKTGLQRYFWDFADDAGKVVADGKYVLVLEGTFDGNEKDPSEVRYRAIIEKGKTITVEDRGAETKGNSKRGKTMISNVKYEIIKK